MLLRLTIIYTPSDLRPGFNEVAANEALNTSLSRLGHEIVEISWNDGDESDGTFSIVVQGLSETVPDAEGQRRSDEAFGERVAEWAYSELKNSPPLPKIILMILACDGRPAAINRIESGSKVHWR